ncbi:MAG: rhamnogalacturonan lyase, partial [Planctomycetota bacterium]
SAGRMGNLLPMLLCGARSAWATSCPSYIFLAAIVWCVAPAQAQRQMENLTRGIAAVKQPDGSVYVGWRLFGTDPETIAFNLYRVADTGGPVKVNKAPIAGSTNYVDHSADASRTLRYFIRPILEGKELSPSKPARAWDNNYLEIPIEPIPEYRPGDASIADLDGDGEYEIVLHQVSRGRDNAHPGITGVPVFDAYEMDGTHLWRINLGINIRDGEHYTQFMVYDLDGDGRAEMACKTADGTIDAAGRVIGDKNKDWRIHKEGDRTHGRILDGPEYFTIFDGLTGKALKTVDYRFLACVAYLDGVRPSVVMCRGVYGRIVMAAWDWRDSELTSRWIFDSGSSYPPFADASPYSGMGGHSLSVADVDDDGKDEIVYHAMVVDDNGKGLYSTGWRHGDAMHISDMYPDRPGLEVFTIHENEGYTTRFKSPGAAMRDARTGKPLWILGPGIDVGRGLAADIDPRHRGYEAWGGPGGLRDRNGDEIGPAPRSNSFAIWWDGDLLRELIGRSGVTKWDWQQGSEQVIFRSNARGGTRGPNIMGDLLGDWREEMLMTAPGGFALRLYTTTIPTEHRIHTLMHDPQYRLAIAWQNVVYNKPPHPGFFLGDGMSPPPRPNVRLIGKGEAIAGTE